MYSDLTPTDAYILETSNETAEIQNLKKEILRFVEKFNNDLSDFKTVPTLLQSLNYLNLDKQTELMKEIGLQIIFEKKLSNQHASSQEKEDINKLICSLANNEKICKLMYSTLKENIISLDVTLQTSTLTECFLSFHHIISKHKIDFILSDIQKEDFFSLESLISIMTDKIEQIIQNSLYKRKELISIIIQIIEDVYSVSLPIQQNMIQKKLMQNESFIFCLIRNGYSFHLLERLYSFLKSSESIRYFWKYYENVIKSLQRNEEDISMNELTTCFKCFCMYIQKEPSTFLSDKENQSIFSTNFILSLITKICSYIRKFLSETLNSDNLNIINFISISISTLQTLYYQANPKVQQRIEKEIYEIQNSCSNMIKNYYAILSNCISNSQNLTQENLKFYGKLLNKLVIIDSSYFSRTIEQQYICIIKDKSIEEIKNINFLKCVFNLASNCSDFQGNSNEYFYLLENIFQKAVNDILNEKINFTLIKVIFQYFAHQNIIITKEFEDIFDKILYYLENKTNKLEISVGLGKDKIIKILQNLQKGKQCKEQLKRKISICIQLINTMFEPDDNYLFNTLSENHNSIDSFSLTEKFENTSSNLVFTNKIPESNSFEETDNNYLFYRSNSINNLNESLHSQSDDVNYDNFFTDFNNFHIQDSENKRINFS